MASGRGGTDTMRHSPGGDQPRKEGGGTPVKRPVASVDKEADTPQKKADTYQRTQGSRKQLTQREASIRSRIETRASVTGVHWYV